MVTDEIVRSRITVDHQSVRVELFKSLGTFLALVLATALFTSNANAAPEATTDTITGETLVSELKSAAAKGDADASHSLNAWNSLSNTGQKEVLAVANSPEFLVAVRSGITDQAALHQISEQLTVDTSSSEFAAAPSVDSAVSAAPAARAAAARSVLWTSWWKNTYKIAGIKITSVKLTFKYEVKNKKVTKTRSCTGTSTNYAPTRSLSIQNVDRWVTNGKGYCSITWRLNYALGWIPTPLHKDFNQNMVVNHKKIVKKYFS